MRYVLAIVAFFVSLPLLLVGGVNAYVLAYEISNADSIRQAIVGEWLWIAIVGAALLVGCGFFAAGLAMLASKPRGEQ